MNTLLIFVKLLIYGLLGHQIFYCLGKSKKFLRSPFSLFYMLFSVGTFYLGGVRLVYQFAFGIVVGLIINTCLYLISDECTVGIHPIWFGFLSIININVLDDIIWLIIDCSSITSIVLIFILGWGTILVDMIRTVREMW